MSGIANALVNPIVKIIVIVLFLLMFGWSINLVNTHVEVGMVGPRNRIRFLK